LRSDSCSIALLTSPPTKYSSTISRTALLNLVMGRGSCSCVVTFETIFWPSSSPASVGTYFRMVSGTTLSSRKKAMACAA